MTFLIRLFLVRHHACQSSWLYSILICHLSFLSFTLAILQFSFLTGEWRPYNWPWASSWSLCCSQLNLYYHREAGQLHDEYRRTGSESCVATEYSGSWRLIDALHHGLLGVNLLLSNIFWLPDWYMTNNLDQHRCKISLSWDSRSPKTIMILKILFSRKKWSRKRNLWLKWKLSLMSGSSKRDSSVT